MFWVLWSQLFWLRVSPVLVALLCGQVFPGSRSCSWVLTMKCATGRREVYSMQIMLQQLLLCAGPSVSCWLPKCHRQPCFCLSLCPLPCPVLLSEVRWLLMALSRQRAHSVTAPRGRAWSLGQPGKAGEGGGGGGEHIRTVWGGGGGGIKPPPLSLCTHVTLVWQPLLCACLNCPSQLALISHSVRMSKHGASSHPTFRHA